MSTAVIRRAIAAFEDRAAQRERAAKRLQALADGESSGLVREELQRGIKNMLDQQIGFLLEAQKLRKSAQGVQGALL